MLARSKVFEPSLLPLSVAPACAAVAVRRMTGNMFRRRGRVSAACVYDAVAEADVRGKLGGGGMRRMTVCPFPAVSAGAASTRV